MASKKMRRAGKYARNKGNNSEKYYAERLQKKLGKEALVFQAGDLTKSGIPDIVAFSKGRISFHEIKSVGDLLKKSQEKWIKKNCLEKRRKACIVFYRTTNRDYFRYHSIRLAKKSIKNYCLSASKSQQEKTKRRIKKWKSSYYTSP